VRGRRTSATEDEAKSLGLALMVLRRSRGLTIMQLSEASDSTRAMLSRYETGHCLPRQDTLRRVTEAMGLPLAALYRTQQLIDIATRRTGPSPADGALPPEDPAIYVVRVPRKTALKLAQEAGKAVAHCCLAFMEFQAGGWEEGRDGE
jgi:transcriptional regulator with XRE-family HTH domain